MKSLLLFFFYGAMMTMSPIRLCLNPTHIPLPTLLPLDVFEWPPTNGWTALAPGYQLSVLSASKAMRAHTRTPKEEDSPLPSFALW